ncbi:MAG: OadG family protein [Oscillospiraceae bacterium]|nr:OadG family protein [Oscillospiraceae bacterium]
MEMQMDWSYVGAVVISGLVIVFVALILLILAVWIMGKIFTAIGSKKSGSGEKKAESAPAPQIKKEPAPILNSAEEDDTEVIAVIAAAVAAMSEELGQPLKIRSIRRAGSSSRSSAWARAAQSESTRAF